MTIDTERLKTDAAYWDEVAPEGCDLYLPQSGFSNGFFFKRSDGLGTHKAIPRPTKTAAPEWNGEGLPPVGTECEVVDDGSLVYGQGESGECIAHVENTAVIRMSYGLGCFEARFLKPARTKAQLDRDELAETVNSGLTKCGFVPSPSDCQVVAVEILSRYTMEPKP